jgi:hypothetical protein
MVNAAACGQVQVSVRLTGCEVVPFLKARQTFLSWWLPPALLCQITFTASLPVCCHLLDSGGMAGLPVLPRAQDWGRKERDWVGGWYIQTTPRGGTVFPPGSSTWHKVEVWH